MKVFSKAAVAALFMAAISAAEPGPALATSSDCDTAVASANSLDIKYYCPRSEWPPEYSARHAVKVVTAPVRAALSALGLR